MSDGGTAVKGGEGSAPKSLFRAISKEIGSAVLRPVSLVVVGVVTTIFAFRAPWGKMDVDVQTTAASIFQVSGTMVALVLPAAQLSNQLITELANAFKLSVKDSVSAERKRSVFLERGDLLRERMSPAWTASVYALCAFILSSVAMVMPEVDIPLGDRFALAIDRLALGLSLGFLVVGSLWFYPTAKYVFRLELIGDIKRAIDILYPTTDQPNAPAGDSTGGSGSQGHTPTTTQPQVTDDEVTARDAVEQRPAEPVENAPQITKRPSSAAPAQQETPAQSMQEAIPQPGIPPSQETPTQTPVGDVNKKESPVEEERRAQGGRAATSAEQEGEISSKGETADAAPEGGK